MKNIALIGALILAFILIGVSFMQINRLERANSELKKTIAQMPATANETKAESNGDEEEEEVEVALYMTHIQRHMNKLYFAGKAGNWDLAGFYVHEVEEMLESLEKHNVVEDDGISLSPLLKAMGLGPLELLEAEVKKKNRDGFEKLYTNQVQQCNACHTASKYPFIKIAVPTSPAFTNQIYTP